MISEPKSILYYFWLRRNMQFLCFACSEKGELSIYRTNPESFMQFAHTYFTNAARYLFGKLFVCLRYEDP